jgi:hypothetical protein
MDTFRQSERFQPPKWIDRRDFGTRDYNLIDKLLHWLGSNLIWPIIKGLMPQDLQSLVNNKRRGDWF